MLTPNINCSSKWFLWNYFIKRKIKSIAVTTYLCLNNVAMFSEHVCYLERIYELYEYLQFSDVLQQGVSSLKKSFTLIIKLKIRTCMCVCAVRFRNLLNAKRKMSLLIWINMGERGDSSICKRKVRLDKNQSQLFYSTFRAWNI